jgi:hypothetical protein
MIRWISNMIYISATKQKNKTVHTILIDFSPFLHFCEYPSNNLLLVVSWKENSNFSELLLQLVPLKSHRRLLLRLLRQLNLFQVNKKSFLIILKIKLINEIAKSTCSMISNCALSKETHLNDICQYWFQF